MLSSQAHLRDALRPSAQRLHSQPLAMQQHLIVGDLLYVLGGFDGQYVRLHNRSLLEAHLLQRLQDSCQTNEPPERPLSRTEASDLVSRAERSPTGAAATTLPQVHRMFTWRIDPSLNASLASLLAQILPMAEYYAIVHAFVHEYRQPRAGVVNQALCSAIDELLQDYYTLLAQMEHLHRTATEASPLTLHKLLFYLRASFNVFERLALLVASIHSHTEQGFLRSCRDEYTHYTNERRLELASAQQPVDSHGGPDWRQRSETIRSEKKYFAALPDNDPQASSHASTNGAGAVGPDGPMPCRGGRTLKVISRELLQSNGDPSAKRLYRFLLSRAGQPFFSMLQVWLQRGEVQDDYDEFMLAARPGTTLFSQPARLPNAQRGLDFLDTSIEPVMPTASGHELETTHLVRLDMTPTFLRPICKKILLTGMYLNIIRACKTRSTQVLSSNHLLPTDMEVDVLADDVDGSLLPANGDHDGRLLAEESFIDRGVLEDGVGTVQAGPLDPVAEAMDGQVYTLQIDNAYSYANRTLLWMLTDQTQLLPRLRALKHFFFLDQSDFLWHFFDMALEDLRRPYYEVPLLTLQSQMDSALLHSASTGASDPYREDVKVRLCDQRLLDVVQTMAVATFIPPSARSATDQASRDDTSGTAMPLDSDSDGTCMMGPPIMGKERAHSTDPSGFGGRDRASSMAASSVPRPASALSRSASSSVASTGSGPMTGLEALVLDFDAQFPASIVISLEAIHQYQIIFRYLLQLKYTEYRLCQVWTNYRAPMARGQTRLSSLHHRIWFLNNCMLNCVRQLVYYTCWEVLEAQWQSLESRLASKMMTIDELIGAHGAMLEQCLVQSLLMVPKLMRVVIKLLQRCNSFALFANNFLKTQSLYSTATPTEPLPPSSDPTVATATATLGRAGVWAVSLEREPTGPTNLLCQQEQTLLKMERGFHSSIENLLDALKHYSDKSTLFTGLATRLDLNNYYASL
ncbi:gamma tubulin complex Spc97/GCP2 subunit Alp4 [Dimargaris verticillata]|uniref:Spindle pole body component n=1 Tax=Dimargaris verticillata TaxID=2761393 RepID=A0A9W8B2V0_9FUNG|nr:gamma tubulin complex Spc97/GCP2 subunit Alp4 [Dimargaris verticillata]